MDRNKRKTKKWLVSILAILLGVIVISVAYKYRHMYLDKKIQSYFSNADEYSVSAIEEMEADKEPVVVDVSDMDDMERVREFVKDIKIQYKKREVGMEITSALYTLTVISDDERLSLTVNEGNEIHFNVDETTYSIVNHKNFYQLLSEVYNDNNY